jgi:hypothetical protein
MGARVTTTVREAAVIVEPVGTFPARSNWIRARVRKELLVVPAARVLDLPRLLAVPPANGSNNVVSAAGDNRTTSASALQPQAMAQAHGSKTSHRILIIIDGSYRRQKRHVTS